MMKLFKRFALGLGIVFILVIFTCCAIIFPHLPAYLSTTKRVKSDILVVEGWVSESAKIQAYNEFISGQYQLLITTGGPMPDDFEMFYNGKLVFESGNQIPQNIYKISVKAFSKIAGGSSAHFVILVNDSMVGSTFTTSDLRQYDFHLGNPMKEVRKIELIFDNDYFVSPAEDRNLFIRSIVIGDQEILARNDHNYFCKGLNSDKIESIAYSSQAVDAMATFVALGINKEQIVSVPAPKVILYKTKNNARALLKWFKQGQMNTHSFNVFSEGIHSRRSWIIYRNLFGKKYKIGIIAAHDPGYENKYWWHSKHNLLHFLKEIAGNFYFRIIK